MASSKSVHDEFKFKTQINCLKKCDIAVIHIELHKGNNMENVYNKLRVSEDQLLNLATIVRIFNFVILNTFLTWLQGLTFLSIE